jgi:hypothetical protein
MIIAGLLAGLGTGAGGGVLLGRKLRTSTTIEGGSLEVRENMEFVTRREWNEWRARSERDAGELKGALQGLTKAMDERDKALTAKMECIVRELAENIKETATNAYNGRSKLWDAHREVEREVAGLAAVVGYKAVQTPNGTGRKQA